MVADERDHRIGMRLHFRGDEIADEPVDRLQRGVRLRRAGARLVLGVIERGEVHRHEAGRVPGDQLGPEAGAVHVGRQVFRLAVGIRQVGGLFELADQPGRRNRIEHIAVVRMAGAPDLRKIPRHVLRCDRDRPEDVAGGEARVMRGIPQRAGLVVLRIPEPAALVDLHGIVGGVVDDAVPRRGHAGDQRGVAGIGHRRQHADDAGRIRALGEEPPQVGHLETARLGVLHIGGPQPVDGNQENGSGARFPCERCCEQSDSKRKRAAHQKPTFTVAKI